MFITITISIVITYVYIYIYIYRKYPELPADLGDPLCP